MPNPLVDQGSLSRVRGSIVWPSFSNLNVTAPYLSKEGIRLALQGESVVYLPTLTGAVTSQEPYMMIDMTIHLLKSQGLSDQYKKQMEFNCLLGGGTIRPDATPLSPYQIVNASIKSVREMTFSGESAVFAVTCGGYYLINSSLFG